MSPPVVYTRAEAAKILKVTPDWLRKQCARRLIPFTKVGGSYHFTEEHLWAILAQFEELPRESRRATPRQAAPPSPHAPTPTPSSDPEPPRRSPTGLTGLRAPPDAARRPRRKSS